MRTTVRFAAGARRNVEFKAVSEGGQEAGRRRVWIMIARLHRLLAMAARERPMFVIVNVAVNLVFLARSYLTMQVLDYRQLGLAALLQSIILLIGLLQFGFINGGYRILCSASPVEAKPVNNLIYTLLGVIAIASILAALISLPFISGRDAQMVAVLGAAGGVITLTRTWMMNTMIARGALVLLNRVNLASGLASLAPLALIPVNPLLACLLAIVAQPLIFAVAAAVADRSLLPGRIEMSWLLAKNVLRVGFLIFVTGIFLQVNIQIERWYITGFLGLEALGHFYVAILFITLFQMVPNSLDQIFLPPIVRAHVSGDGESVSRGMRQFFQVSTAYCVIAALAIAVLAQPITALVLPKYLPDLQYVYLLAPGIVLFTLASPLAIPFSVLIRYGYYFTSYGVGFVVTALAFLYAASAGGVMNLADVSVVRSAVYWLMAAILVFGFVRLTRDRPHFRFDPFQSFRRGRGATGQQS